METKAQDKLISNMKEKARQCKIFCEASYYLDSLYKNFPEEIKEYESLSSVEDRDERKYLYQEAIFCWNETFEHLLAMDKNTFFHTNFSEEIEQLMRVYAQLIDAAIWVKNNL